MLIILLLVIISVYQGLPLQRGKNKLDEFLVTCIKFIVAAVFEYAVVLAVIFYQEKLFSIMKILNVPSNA